MWGRRDCALWASEWIHIARGVDPLRDYRGLYDTEAECLALVARLGGLTPFTRRRFASYGLSETDAPVRQDVALVDLRGQITAGIVLGKGFVAFKAPLGVAATRAPIVTAWSI